MAPKLAAGLQLQSGLSTPGGEVVTIRKTRRTEALRPFGRLILAACLTGCVSACSGGLTPSEVAQSSSLTTVGPISPADPGAPGSAALPTATATLTGYTGALAVTPPGPQRTVCASGCQFTLPSTAVAAAQPGDVIAIQAGTYNDCINVNVNNLTITGVGGMAALTGKVCSQKGIVVTMAQNTLLQNLELYGVSNADNYAGIRHDALGKNLTLDNVYVHDNDDGILGSSNTDSVLIKNSKFENNGMNKSTGYGHDIYISPTSSFSLINSLIIHAKLGGHEVKSRAARTDIEGTTIATLGGEDSRDIDACNGGELILINNVIEKGPGSQNSDLIAYAAEAFTPTFKNSITATANIVIDDKNQGTLITLFKVPALSITNNQLVGIATIVSGMTFTGNNTFSSRAAAGFAAYPALPTVPKN
jgi:hypothetical protein